MCLVSLTLTLLPAVLPSSTLLTKMPNPCSEPPRTLKPSLPSTLFSTVMALMTSLSLLLAVGTGEQMSHTRCMCAMARDVSLAGNIPRPRTALSAPRPREFSHWGLLAMGVGRGPGYPTHLQWGH